MQIVSWVVVKLLIISFFFPLSATADWYKQHQSVMGTRISVDIWHDDKVRAEKCIDAVMAEMYRIDALMSPYKATSALSRLNQNAYKQAIRPGDEVFNLIERALEVSRMSGGAFDITFASVGYQYDYRKGVHPSDEAIKNTISGLDYHHIKLNKKDKSIRFANEKVKIDLGGIAKGHAVDNGIQILKKCGVKNGIVTAGGDSRILGDRQGRPWMMGVKQPRVKEGVAVVLPLSNMAISTSGDYERYFIEDGRRYHHIINPGNGKPVSSVWSVTVIGPDATTTDAMSTTLFVLGVDRGLSLVEKMPDFDAVIIDATGKMHYSEGLMPPEQAGKN